MARQTPRKPELIARITGLRGQGKSWDEVTEAITHEGFVNAKDEKYKSDSLEAAYSKWLKPKAGTTVKAENSPTIEVDQVPTESPESGMTVDPSPQSMTDEPESGPTSEPGEVPTGQAESSMTADVPLSGMTDESECHPTIEEPIPVPISLGVTSGAESGMTTHGEPNPTDQAESSLTPETRAMIAEFMEQELKRIMTGISVEQVQKPGRGGTAQAVKKSFSIPLDVWNEFEGRFHGCILSNHVAAALRAYLRIMGTSQGGE